jgi:hypothetical protein
MNANRSLSIIVLSCLPTVLLAAQTLDFSDQAFTQVAVTLTTFDALAKRCADNGGFGESDAARVLDWQRRNQVERLRSHLRVLERAPESREKIARMRAGIEQRVMQRVPDSQACTAAVATTRIESAQFAESAPDILESLPPPVSTSPSGVASDAGAGPKGNDKTAIQNPRTTNIRPSALAAQIDSFGFDSVMRMGFGGAVYPTPIPVVLFRNGDALTDVEGLSYPGGIEAHKRANPNDWTKWRRSGGRIQLLDPESGWENAAYNVAYAKLPEGYRLDGTYSSLSGSGNLAIGGTDSVAAWRSYAFAPNGRVIRGGGAGAYAQALGGSTAVSSIAPTQRGSYRIDGLTLQITYDDGSKESRVIVTNPEDRDDVIWLDGIGYTRDDK